MIEKVINAPKKESVLNIFIFNWKSIDLSSNKQNADKTLVRSYIKYCLDFVIIKLHYYK